MLLLLYEPVFTHSESIFKTSESQFDIVHFLFKCMLWTMMLLFYTEAQLKQNNSQ